MGMPMGFASFAPSSRRGRPKPVPAPVPCPACLQPWPAVTDLLAALLLGIIEGITEFRPISSTGHLLIAQHGRGHRSDLFNISIQAGAILAIALIYRQRLWDLAMGFLGRRAPAGHDPAGISLDPAQARDYALKLGVAFGVTCVLGLAVKNADRIGALFGQDWQAFELPEATTPIAWALILGGVWMVVAEHFAARRAKALGERTAISWTVAILVGIAQVVAGVALKVGVAVVVAWGLGLAVKNAERIGALFGQDWQAFELPEATTPIAWALIRGGVWMVVAEHFAARRAKALGERTAISWTVAILVGIAQVVAGVFPGTSRSAATIFVALLFGTTSRVAATEFAFLVGIPTMFAATAYELVDEIGSAAGRERVWQ